MARFFKAPTLQPVDYGYKMPFNEIYGALQKKQQEQDTNTAAFQELQDSVINTKEQDFALRNAKLQNRRSRIDALMYDEEGNVKDLTGMSSVVRKEARLQATEEMTGGQVWALESTLKKSDEYVAQVQKQFEKGDISKDRRDWGVATSESQYTQRGGLGQKDEYGQSDLFSGISLAKEVNEFEIAADYVQGWRSDQIQTAYTPGSPGTVRFDDKYLEELQQKYPEMGYQGPKGASKDYVQTGTLEYVLFNEVYEGAFTKLANDQDVVQDLRQEAQQKGAQTQEQISQYVMQKIGDASEEAAEKESHFKFSPNIRESWRAKERVQQRNRISLEQWKLDQQPDDFNVGSTDRAVRTVSSGNVKEEIEKLNGSLQLTNDKISKYETKNGFKDPNYFNKLPPAEKAEAEAEYEQLLEERSIIQAQKNRQNEVLVDLAGKSGAVDELPGQLDTYLGGMFGNMTHVLGISNDSPEYQQAADLYTKEVAPLINNLSPEDLAAAVSSGEIPGLRVAIEGIYNVLESTGSERKYPKGGLTGSKGYLSVDQIVEGFTEIVKVPMQQAAESTDVTYTTDYQEITPGVQTNKDKLFRMTKDLTQRVKSGSIQLVNPDFTPVANIEETIWDYLKDGDYQYDKKKGIQEVTHTMNYDKHGYGAPVVLVKVYDTAGQPQTIPLYVDKTSDNSVEANMADMAIGKIHGAEQLKGDVKARETYLNAANILGKTVYARKFSKANIRHMPKNTDRVITTPRGDKLMVRKTNEGQYSVFEAKKDPYTDDYIKVTDTDKGSGGALREHGLYGDESDFIFKTENDLYRWFGELEYDAQKNRHNPNYRKR